MINYRRTLTECRHGRLDGTWSLTPPSARLCGWHPPGSLSTRSIYCMDRCWRLSAAPGTCGWIFPATTAGRITAKGNRSLGFIKRIIKTKAPQDREIANQSLFRPQLEYASAMWDPNTKDKTHKVEMVQKRAAQWTLRDHGRTTSVTSLQSQLNWQTLEERRSMARPCLFYKIVNGLVAVPLPDYMQHIHRISRYCHSMTFHQTHTDKDYYKYSFFPLAIVQWNTLPANVAVTPDNCSIPYPRQYTTYFNMFLIILDPFIFIILKYDRHKCFYWSILDSCFYSCLIFDLILTFHLYPGSLQFIHLVFFFITLTHSACKMLARE